MAHSIRSLDEWKQEGDQSRQQHDNDKTQRKRNVLLLTDSQIKSPPRDQLHRSVKIQSVGLSPVLRRKLLVRSFAPSTNFAVLGNDFRIGFCLLKMNHHRKYKSGRRLHFRVDHSVESKENVLEIEIVRGWFGGTRTAALCDLLLHGKCDRPTPQLLPVGRKFFYVFQILANNFAFRIYILPKTVLTFENLHPQ